MAVSQPRRGVRLLRWAWPRGLRRVHSTRLGRAALPALHPGARARLAGAALLAALLAPALVPPTACAAPRDTSGTVVGWVRDSLSGRALPYASVVVEGTHVGAMADTSGWFRLAGVPAGERVIQVLALGFRRGQAQIRVRAARTDTVRLRLRVMPIATLNFNRVAPPPGPRPHP